MCVCTSTCVLIPHIVHMYVMQYPLLSFGFHDMDVFIGYSCTHNPLFKTCYSTPPPLLSSLPLSLPPSLSLTHTHTHIHTPTFTHPLTHTTAQTVPVGKNSDRSHRLPDFSGKPLTWAVLTSAELVLQEMAAKGEELATDRQKRASINSINKCPLCVP